MFKKHSGTGVSGSSRHHSPVGSGSRPGHSKIAIPTTAPKHPHHLDKKPPSPMK